jgi:hypothetical protein
MDIADISITLAIGWIRKIYRSRLGLYVVFPVELIGRLCIMPGCLADDLQISDCACGCFTQAHHLTTAEQYNMKAD